MKRLSQIFGFKSDLSRSEEPSQIPSSLQSCTVEGRAVDEHRPLRVIVIGAGISGILCCIRMNQRIANLDLCIYEKNADIGGTWFENQYPGCACGMSSLLLKIVTAITWKGCLLT